MNIFDSAAINNWNGNGFSVEKNFLLLHSNTLASHSITVEKGDYSVTIIGKKRTGNGRATIKIVSEGDCEIFSEDIIVSKTSWTEFKFSFSADIQYGLSSFVIKRGSNSFGSMEIGRIKIERSDKKERSKRIKKREHRSSLPLTIDFPDLALRPKITFIIPYGIYGGAEVYIKNILENIDLNAYQVSLAFLAKNKFMHIIQDPRIEKRLCRNLDALQGFLISNEPDYIVYYNRADVYRLLSSAKETLNCKLIEIYHSDFKWPGSLSQVKTREGADLLFSVSESLGGDLLPEQKRFVIPVGISLKKFSFRGKDSEFKAQLLQGREKLIGCVARISPEKNIEYLLSLAKKLQKYSFIIVGDGPDLKAMRYFADDNVEFVGFKKDIQRYYSAFDGFVLPSKMEGTPISIIEAMASGATVFTSKVGAIPDIISDKETGIFLSGNRLRDAKIIKKYIDNQDIKINARRYVEENHDIIIKADEFMKNMIDYRRGFILKDSDDAGLPLPGRFI